MTIICCSIYAPLDTLLKKNIFFFNSYKLGLLDPVLYQHLFFTIITYTIPIIILPSKFNFETHTTYPNTNLPSESFLEWLIGFTEKDGSFIVNSRNTPVFVITQTSKY